MLILANGTVVTGDGKMVIFGGTVVVDGGRIAEVRQSPISGGPRDRTIDLAGRLLVPGAINPHAHGVVVCPLFSSGAPPLSLEKTLANLDPGKVADLVVCRDRLDRVDLVFVNGELAVEGGRVRRRTAETARG